MTTKNCCGSSGIMSSESCGCCEGVERLTPRSTANRPGLSELAYRIGTHAEFLETMQARLSSQDFPELAGLTTRDGSDPTLALLDAWAAVADVLTFYQERIANEGYLRTADERRSILELGRLVGYKMRPGVSASAFLAYAIDENSKEEVTIPAGSRVQSIPGPDELPQTFESSEDLKARSGWNNLRPRMTQPQTDILQKNRIYFKGINTNLSLNDPLVIDCGNDDPQLRWVKEIRPDAENNRTLILLKKPNGDSQENTYQLNAEMLSTLVSPPSRPPASPEKLRRNTANAFGLKKNHPKLSEVGTADTNHALLKACNLKLRDTLTAALAQAKAAPANEIRVYALRKKAAPFGHNAPLKPIGMDQNKVMLYEEWEIDQPALGVSEPIASFVMKNVMHTNQGYSAYTGSSIEFKNTSKGLIETAIWDFGEGKAVEHDLSDLTHIYITSNNSPYTVTLTVQGPGGSHPTSIDIMIVDPIIA